MRPPILVRREHLADPMIPDIDIATDISIASQCLPQVESIFVYLCHRPHMTRNRDQNGGVHFAG